MNFNPRAFYGFGKFTSSRGSLNRIFNNYNRISPNLNIAFNLTFNTNYFDNTPTTTTTNLELKPLIYTFINTNNADNETIARHIPIINTDGKITFTNTIEVINVNTKKTKVTVTYTLAPDYFTDLPPNDGLSFNIVNRETNTILPDFYKNQVDILQFGNIPLSRAGYQFNYIEGIEFSALDTPQILQGTHLDYAFAGTNFNSPLNHWDVTNVVFMTGMFQNAIEFNQNISSWFVTNVLDFSAMFSGAKKFNKNLSSWQLNSSGPGIANIFSNAETFNNGQGSQGTQTPLGSGWNPVAYYTGLWKNGSALTVQNSRPLS